LIERLAAMIPPLLVHRVDADNPGSLPAERDRHSAAVSTPVD